MLYMLRIDFMYLAFFSSWTATPPRIAAHKNGLAAQFRVVELLDRGEELIHIYVYDRSEHATIITSSGLELSRLNPYRRTAIMIHAILYSPIRVDRSKFRKGMTIWANSENLRQTFLPNVTAFRTLPPVIPDTDRWDGFGRWYLSCETCLLTEPIRPHTAE